MNTDQIEKHILDALFRKAENVLESRANALVSFVDYEISLVNMEQALNKNRGAGYAFLSKDYADKIHIGAISNDSQNVSLRLSLPQNAFAEADPQELECFKEYVLPNAIARLKNI